MGIFTASLGLAIALAECGSKDAPTEASRAAAPAPTLIAAFDGCAP